MLRANLVEGHRVGALLHDRRRLGEQRPEAAVDVESGDILYDDDGLTLADAHVDGGGEEFGVSASVGDDLEKWHLRYW